MGFNETLWHVVLYDEIFGFDAKERLTRKSPATVKFANQMLVWINRT
jgi:hypothetical protein